MGDGWKERKRKYISDKKCLVSSDEQWNTIGLTVVREETIESLQNKFFP